MTRSHALVRIGAIPVVAALAAIACADLIAWRVSPSIGAWGVLDETAHAATAFIVLAAFGTRFRRRTVLAVVVGAVVLDVDHIPGLVGWHFLDDGAPRPYTHSLLGAAIALAVALAVARRVGPLALAVWGAIALHLWRDLAEPDGPGVSLLWPLTDRAFTIGYLWYIVPLAVAAAIALRRRTGQRAELP
jgi:membrane-bound metal-dependent hydrolase YbcI (DUF457 family)